MSIRHCLVVIFYLIIISGICAQSEVAKVEDEKPVGPWTIGGNFRFHSSNTNDLSNFTYFNTVDKSNHFSISPALAYGISNRTSATLFLGYSTGKQAGQSTSLFTNDPIIFVSRDAEEKVQGYSIGVSADHYFILKDLFGFRLELGAILKSQNSELIFDEINSGLIIEPKGIVNTKTQIVNFFFGPSIDFFIGQRINITLNMGNIGYTTQWDKEDSDDAKINRFESTLSPDNVGLGIEFNF